MKKLISYVLPVFNESGNIDPLYKALSDLALQHKEYNYEFIFINDGSQDDSYNKLKRIQVSDPRVTVVNLSRNFGHQLAVTAGLDIAMGDAVIIMDSDLQDPPKVSLELLQKWSEGYDVVYAQRKTRQDSWFKKLTANWYYIVLEKLADIKIPRDTGDFKLLDRKVVNSLNLFQEHNRFLRGLVSYAGFKQTGILFDRDARHSGETNYPLREMLNLAGNGILGFSTFPLKIISRLGYFVSGISFLGILYALIVKLFDSHAAVPGWAFIVIAILFVGGIQLIILGVLGSYIGRIYTEAQGRPLYLIESVLRNNKKT
jgi:glycosyltransferase involved in cell wall biosynthesis